MLWVTGPDHYLDADGSERADLEPGQAYQRGMWWTCHADTKEGDLVVLYRSKPKSDVAYLIETRCDAYELKDEGDAARGWDFGCDYEVVEKFARPLTFSEMREDATLDAWRPLRARFRRRVYAVPADIWKHLLGRLSDGRHSA